MATIPAYSRVLWELGPGWTPPGPELSAPVPAGFVWVIRDVTASVQGTPTGGQVPYLQFYVDGWQAWNTPIGESIGGVAYSQLDTRHVLQAGSFLSVVSQIGQWQFRACGYQLSA